MKFSTALLVLGLVAHPVQTRAEAQDSPKLEACAAYVGATVASKIRIGATFDIIRRVGDFQAGLRDVYPYLIESEIEVARAAVHLVVLLSDNEVVEFARATKSDGFKNGMSVKRAKNHLRRKFESNFWLGPAMIGGESVDDTRSLFELLGVWYKNLEDLTERGKEFCEKLNRISIGSQ
tara:strand:+ start:4032 stop:4565 length:534 start_codon:yes stop_codon:yes gene_type:complete